LDLKPIKAREGDFIETNEGLIFDVKGLVHPPNRIIAYLRYIEDPLGDRSRESRRYRKIYSLSDRESVLKSKHPHYIYYDNVFGEWLQGVPDRLVAEHYKPSEKTLNLLNKQTSSEVEASAAKFVEEIHDYTGVPLRSLGISGSILVGLWTPESDIDIIVYGRRNSLSVYEGLKVLLRDRGRGFSPYNRYDLIRLYEFRSKDTRMPFDKFCGVERRKASQGKFLGRDFFVRFILDWDEVGEKYGDRIYRSAGYARIKARIYDDSDSIFTPCVYRVSEVKVIKGECNPNLLMEIVSFRGRFSCQAKENEEIIAQGKVEMVIEQNGEEYCRMVLGANPSDFMVVEDNL